MVWANDDLANATALTGASGSITPLTYDSTVDPATSETGEPVYGAGETLWWTWTAPSSGDFEFATVGSPAASGDPFGLDTVLQVFTGPSSSPTYAALTFVGRNDDNAAGDTYVTNSRFIFTAAAGTTYYVQLDQYGSGQAGTLHLSWAPYVPPTPPYDPPVFVEDSGFASFDVFTNFLHFIGSQDYTPNASVTGWPLELRVYHCADVDLVTFAGGYSQAPDAVHPTFNQVDLALPYPLPPNLLSGPVTVHATDPATGIQYTATSSSWFFPLVPEPGVDDAHGWRDLPSETHTYTNTGGGGWADITSQTWNSTISGVAATDSSPSKITIAGNAATPESAADVACGHFSLNPFVPDDSAAAMPTIPAGLREHDGDPFAGAYASRTDPLSGDPWGWERENLAQDPPPWNWPNNQGASPRFPCRVKHPSQVLHFGFVTGGVGGGPMWPQDLRIYLIPPSMWTYDGFGTLIRDDPIDHAGFAALHLAGSVTIPTTFDTAFTLDAVVPEAYIGDTGEILYRVAFGDWVDAAAIPDGETDIFLKYAVPDTTRNCLHSTTVTYQPWGYRYWIPKTSTAVATGWQVGSVAW